MDACRRCIGKRGSLPVREYLCDESGRTDFVQRIDVRELHGLCQPLTSLQCRSGAGRVNRTTRMRCARRFDEALQECARLNRTVGTMRMMLQEMRADQERRRGHA